MGAEPIKDLVKGVIKGWKKEAPDFTQDRIAEIWRAAASAKLARHSRPASFRAGRLVVNVDSSGYLYELTIERPRILKRLRKKFKKKPIQELQFRIGQI